MKFDPSGETVRGANMERHSLSAVVYDMTTREGYIGDAFRDRYHAADPVAGQATLPASGEGVAGSFDPTRFSGGDNA